jgi:hypothetical protein
MLWNSIITGFSLFAKWQIWLSVTFYTIFSLFYFWLLSKKGVNNDIKRKSNIKGFIIHGILISLLVSYLLPVLLGSDNSIGISYLLNNIFKIILCGIIAALVIILLYKIPFIGPSIANAPGIQIFIEGVIIFRILTVTYINEMFRHTTLKNELYPDFWDGIFFLLVTIILRFIFISLISPLIKKILFKNSEIQYFMLIIFAPIYNILSGLIPFFMYCSHVKLSIISNL